MTDSQHKIYLARAFGDSERTGNPAGVVLGADRLESSEKQEIAKQVGFSETAFITKRGETDVTLEFFTPEREIENCGHATVASLFVMKKVGLLKRDRHTFRTKASPQVKEALFQDGKVFMEQFPETSEELSGDLRTAALATVSASVVSPPVFVSTGNRFLLLEVQSPADLARLTPDLSKLEKLSREHNLIGSYVYARTPGQRAIATTRMFAPLYGIPEDRKRHV